MSRSPHHVLAPTMTVRRRARPIHPRKRRVKVRTTTRPAVPPRKRAAAGLTWVATPETWAPTADVRRPRRAYRREGRLRTRRREGDVRQVARVRNGRHPPPGAAR